MNNKKRDTQETVFWFPENVALPFRCLSEDDGNILKGQGFCVYLFDEEVCWHKSKFFDNFAEANEFRRLTLELHPEWKVVVYRTTEHPVRQLFSNEGIAGE